MIARSRQVALALTVVLAAGAAWQDRDRRPPESGHPGAPVVRDRGFTLVASGDVLPRGSAINRARFDAGGSGHDFGPMLSGVRSVVAGADLALCHMGTVYGAGGDSTDFESPPEIAQALAATGYDGCSIASRHIPGDGTDGIRRTLDALDRAGLRHAGAARSEHEARRATVLRAGRAEVAHLAYTYGTGVAPLPSGEPRAVGLVDEARILADARTARKAGADVVVVSLHWGAEWEEAPDGRQVALARSLTAARTGHRPDIDLILGTHSHVPQAYEKVNGTWVVYGTGDQIADAMTGRQGLPDPRGNQSTLGRFTFTPPGHPDGRWEVTKAEFVPQFYDVDAGRVVDLNRALAEGAEVRSVRDRIRTVVLSRGAAMDGLVMGE
ncbi:CapA family protein [Streptomyces hirsutus]|uniref:CapA family protein n=1 Tax=Streptomyces hirsutus TaxID=35620 RepID=A0ABZ1GWI3_9ACTN|nr:CapA family protein [Streptomyces hirsutus]WSD10588.1 CapA family protein [Streptomyces hirsutus]